MMVWALLGYLVCQLGVCWLASRWVTNQADYLLAGRRLGLGLASVSLFATWFGAEVVMGSSGAIATDGLSAGRADPFGYTCCLVLMGLLLAVPFRQAGYVTVGDFFRQHYGQTSEVLASILLIITSLIWTAAQIQAFGWILTTVTSLELAHTLPIAVALVIAYTWLGGLMGDVVTDVVQGGLLMLGLMALLVVVLGQAGGMTAALHHVSPQQWSLLRSGESWLSQANVWAIPILGSLVAPEALTRTLATNSQETAQRACFIGGGLYLLMGSVVVAIALVGGGLIGGQYHQADQFLPTLIQSALPPWASLLLLGALVSAILSTIDSTLLSIAGLVSHNLIQPWWHWLKRPPLSDGRQVALARCVVILSGLIAYGLATGSRGIYGLVELASSFGSAGFLVCVLGGLYWPQRHVVLGRSANAIGLVVLSVGAVQTVVYELWWQLEGAFILNIAGCALVYVASQLYTRLLVPYHAAKS